MYFTYLGSISYVLCFPYNAHSKEEMIALHKAGSL